MWLINVGRGFRPGLASNDPQVMISPAHPTDS